MIKNRSLKRIGIYLLAGMFFILTTEYLIIRAKIEVLEEVEEQKDFARSAQLNGQQITLLVQECLNNQPHLSSEIVSRLDQQDYLLKTLREGGRLDGTQVFLKPLSRIPRITFNELDRAWIKYKDTVLTTLVNSRAIVNDSIQQVKSSAERILLPAHAITLANWFKKLEIDLTDEADRKKIAVENWVLAFIFLDIILLIGLYYLFNRFLILPLKILKNNTQNHQQNFIYPANEVGGVTHEVNEVLEQLKDATDFVSAIGEGKLDFDYKILDSQYAPGKNKLADSLIAMQDKLRDMSMEEQRRQWANEGLTKFVDILRSGNDNITSLGDKIIGALVQYTNSSQGGLYILNDENENDLYLELISLFALDRKKFDQQKIKPGEGILGQTFLEKQTTLLKEIPEDYIRITSGLGETNPKSILIVPLKVDDNVYGIVELASLKYYQQYEISFVEKLAETIASTLASVKVAHKNKHLIEQFQIQTEQMRAQEEEVRQNMEELQATQEEMGRKEQDYINRIKALEAHIANNKNDSEVERLKEEFDRKEAAYKKQLADLQIKTAVRSDDWQVAEEIAKTFQIQLEGLRISNEEFPSNSKI